MDFSTLMNMRLFCRSFCQKYTDFKLFVYLFCVSHPFFIVTLAVVLQFGWLAGINVLWSLKHPSVTGGKWWFFTHYLPLRWWRRRRLMGQTNILRAWRVLLDLQNQSKLKFNLVMLYLSCQPKFFSCHRGAWDKLWVNMSNSFFF